MDLTFVLLELIAPAAKAWLLALVENEPAVITNDPVLEKGLLKDHEPPTPFKVTSKLPIATLLVEMVLVLVAKKLSAAPVVVVNTTPLDALAQLL
jgi:hypothetical protein